MPGIGDRVTRADGPTQASVADCRDAQCIRSRPEDLLKLAKPRLDVGVMTHRAEPMLAFWQQQAGLPFEETLPVARGQRQHRHGLNGSVFKLNAFRDELPATPAGGLRRLTIARAGIDAPRDLVDPDGNALRLVPPGDEEVVGIAIDLAVRDLSRAEHFYAELLGFEPLSREGGRDRAPRYRCGDSLLRMHEDPEAQSEVPILAPGYRYLTVQVFDCEGEHRRVLALGGREGAPPRRAGEVAIFSMVRDPDGNWIEISQRASLTGSLDPRYER